MAEGRPSWNEALTGRVAFLGVGNPDHGDDGLGLALARALRERGVPDALEAGAAPEDWLMTSWPDAFDQIVLLDAVEFGGPPGAVVWLDAPALAARFPQVSTHKLSLGLLASGVERRGRTRVWLLGVQPQTLAASPPVPGADSLSPVVRRTIDLLATLLADEAADRPTAPARRALSSP